MFNRTVELLKDRNICVRKKVHQDTKVIVIPVYPAGLSYRITSSIIGNFESFFKEASWKCSICDVSPLFFYLSRPSNNSTFAGFFLIHFEQISKTLLVFDDKITLMSFFFSNITIFPSNFFQSIFRL